MKAFKRAAELDPRSVYSAYQVASIEHILGENEKAAIGFEALLSRTPNFVPALKGLAETYLSQAEEYQSEGFIGRLVECCSKSLELLVRASVLGPHLACLWSLLGQTCLHLRSVPDKDIARLRIPSVLIDEKNDSLLPSRRQVMELGSRFFLCAVKLLPDSASLWHNLAVSYQSSWLLDRCDSSKISAEAAVKRALALEPKEPSHWDLLGLIAQEPAVAQHAFIRALELNPTAHRAAATWANLGALYLEHANLQLAHECFKQSQNVDPLYVAAWIGQASIAEQLSPAEAMDLFRHTLSIGSGRPGQCEGSPSYAQWVINTLQTDAQTKRTAHYRYNIVQMHAVPTAVDGLVHYVALYPDDSCSLNLLGLLYERQGLLNNAADSFLRGTFYQSYFRLHLYCKIVL